MSVVRASVQRQLKGLKCRNIVRHDEVQIDDRFMPSGGVQ